MSQGRCSEYSTSEDTRQLINKTFADLELTGKVNHRVGFIHINISSHNLKAHTFDEWCTECGCIHLEDVFKDTLKMEDTANTGEESATAAVNTAEIKLRDILDRL